jgi:hypothetical protein
MDFDSKKNDFLRIFYEYQYIFEIQKCCGYTEWISVYKKDTLRQLYHNLNIQFATNEKTNHKLFFNDNDGDMVFIENNEMNISDFIRIHSLKPIYPLPHWIVYKLYLDDGDCHKNHSKENIYCVLHDLNIK